MKVLRAEFVTSAAAGGRADGIPADGLAQVAFAGRSNVGKSTLLNALARQIVARTSAAPGKTRLANIYRLNAEGGAGGPGRWSVYFVDLPGYGYARGGSDAAVELASVAAAYFQPATPVARRFSGASKTELTNSNADATGEERLNRTVLHLIDSRHPGLESDIQAGRWFDSLGVDRHIVATKIDKLTRAERDRNLRELGRIFERAAVPVSVSSGEGLEELWKLIARVARDQHR